jgi:transcriptional regulator with XRE-family HTH domain
MNAIARIRIYKGLSQKEIAAKAKISLNTYRTYEKFEITSIKYNKLMLIANALGVETQELINGRY